MYTNSGKLPDESSWIASTAHVYMNSDKNPLVFNLCSTKSIYELFTTTELSNEAKNIKHILIEGVSKIGKTILAKKIAYWWANGKVFNSKLLFFVHLGDPKLKEIQSVEKLIEYCTHMIVSPTAPTTVSLTKAVKKYILDNHGNNVAFVFDAFNEYSVDLQRISSIMNVLKKDSHKSTVIIALQSTAAHLLHDAVDGRIKILGISNEAQENYIKSKHSNLPIKQKFEKYCKDHPIIGGLCYVPCHFEALLKLLFLYDDCDLPKTLANVNSLFILHILESSKVKKLDDLPEEFLELAFRGLEKGQSVFTHDEIKKAYPDLEDSPGISSVSGLLQDYMEGKIFFRSLIQEYLAAFYVSTLPEKEQLECIKNNFEKECFKFMWTMYAGIVPKIFVSFINENANEYNNLFTFQCFMQTIKCNETVKTDSCIFSSCGIESTESWKLENSKLNDVEMNSLLEYVVLNEKSLACVNLSGNNSSPWGVYCAVIRHCKNKSLILCGDEQMNQYIKEIADSLQQNEVLTSLILCKIGSIGLESIKEVLSNSSKLTKVYLSWTKIVEDESEIDNVLVHRKFNSSEHPVDINIFHDNDSVDFPDLTLFESADVNLSNKGINDDAVCLIAFGLHDNKTVQKLNLSHNKITDVGAKCIADCLKNNSTLQELNLSWNCITKVGAEEITGDNDSLHKLNISHNSISHCATSLISNYSKLEEIDLSENKIQLSEWNIEGDTSKLEYIDFSGNLSSPWNIYCAIIGDCRVSRLTLCGCLGMKNYSKEIIDTLKESETLQWLTLCHTEKIPLDNKFCRRNKIEIKGILNLSPSTGEIVKKLHINVSYNYDIKDSCENEHINISNQDLDDDVVQLIAFGLYNNKTVQTFDLSCNKITDDGAAAISDCLKNKAMLHELNLSENNISKVGAKKIAQTLERNRKLQKLDMMGNQTTGNHIGDDGAMAFAVCLENNRTLCKINLSRNKIGDKGAKEIAKALKNNSTLQELDISDNLVTDDGVMFISNCLKSNTGLKKLNLLRNGSITVTALQKIVEVKSLVYISVTGMSHDEISFSDNSTLHILDLSGNNITAKYAKIIGNVVKLSTELHELNFAQSSIGDSSVGAISECLTNSSLQILKMPDNYISSKGMKKIVEGIRNNKSLQTLDFSNNRISDDGVKAISEYLQSDNCKLQKLNLSSTSMTSKGAGYIADAIRLNATLMLQELNISYNNISDNGIEAISKQLMNNIPQEGGQSQVARGLEKLFISHIKISDNGIRAIKDCLMNNCTLRVLDLSNNDITSGSIKVIAETLQHNSALQILDISNNKIRDDGIISISNHLNDTLQQLYVSSNRITEKGLERLAKAIKKCNQGLQLLDISGNNIMEYEEIITCLKTNTALQEVIVKHS